MCVLSCDDVKDFVSVSYTCANCVYVCVVVKFVFIFVYIVTCISSGHL